MTSEVCTIGLELAKSVFRVHAKVTVRHRSYEDDISIVQTDLRRALSSPPI